MDYAVTLNFDEKSQAQLLGMMEDLCRAGVNRYLLDLGIRPHITLAYWKDQNGIDVTDEIRRFAGVVKGTYVLFSSIGIFPADPRVVYLSPVKDDGLIKLHNGLYQELNGKIENYSQNYTPDYWVPHCTLATKLSEAEVLMSVNTLLKVKFPVKAQISQIELVECSPKEDILSCEVKFKHDLGK
ncbi:MAG: 2'-5' RNA ligase family protein [Bacteroidota bacterium]